MIEWMNDGVVVLGVCFVFDLMQIELKPLQRL